MPDIQIKILGPGGVCVHGGKGTWHLPRGQRPGKWMSAIPEPRCCARGYHLVSLAAAAEWLRPDCSIYVAEGSGGSDTDGSDKIAWERARLLRRLPWDDRIARLYAADCAEHVLPIWEDMYPDDPRPRKAIDAARAFACGQIGPEELVASEAAARAAARPAARVAAGATWTAWIAAEAAARAAAGPATWAAEAVVRAAAGAAERAWRGRRLAWYLGLEEMT